jgi:hypothetical protein
MRIGTRIAVLATVVSVTALVAVGDAGRHAVHAGTACPPGYQVVHIGEEHACTHGGDPAPPAGTVAALRGAAELPEAACPGNGRQGKRIRVFYGYPEGTERRLPDVKPSIAESLRVADANLDAQTEGVEGQHYRFWCETDVRPTVRAIQLRAIGADDAYSVTDVAVSLRDQVSLGLGDQDHRAGRMAYVVFVDHLEGVSAPAGQGTLYLDDDPDPAGNANNLSSLGPKVSLVSLGHGVATLAHIFQHEVGHNLGAVQMSAPHSSGAGHCYELYDLMCYDDGGPYFAGGGDLVPACDLMPGGQHVWDCNGDDWYATEPAAGAYLDDHWNVADSGWLSWHP